MKYQFIAAALTAAASISFPAMAENVITYEPHEGFILVHQTEGPTLGYSPASGMKILVQDGMAFKVRGDILQPFEDWRRSPEARATDLAKRLSLDEIAGLMLYSPQNKVPMPDTWDKYGGKPWSQAGVPADALSDGQLKFLRDDNVRHVLVSYMRTPADAARWNNRVQALVEGLGHGIPANNSSDPRHSAMYDAEFAPGSSGELSLWSTTLGLGATFDPSIVREFADIASQEYRALGIATALSPQIDIATDPRWYRFNSTFGNDPVLNAEMARAYCDGFQTTRGTAGGWGTSSVNAMCKHWPGGGSGEGGRDAHYGKGKYAVYPGGCYEQHKIPFTHGAFRLAGPTGQATAVMPYYTISYNQTPENVGNSFNRDIIQRQLRHDQAFRGVICTDWVITADFTDNGTHNAKPWGVEELTVAQRHYKALMAGVDQFGGNQEKQPILDAYEMGVKEHGASWMRQRMEQSAVRLLLNIIRPGLMENPYVVPEQTAATVGQKEWMARGYDQQLKSVVMLKNHHNVLPLGNTLVKSEEWSVERQVTEGDSTHSKGCETTQPSSPFTLHSSLKVFVPKRHEPRQQSYWSQTWQQPYDVEMVSKALGNRYFEMVDTPEEADAAIVFMQSPVSHGRGYDKADLEQGGNGFVPISLQYRPYTATEAREHSIAADPLHDNGHPDRSYRGKSTYTYNECDLDTLVAVRKALGQKPVIAVINVANPPVLSEVEPLVDALLVGSAVSTQAYLDLITGRAEPSGLLPYEMPISMEAVEHHCEDRPHDIEPYLDADGNRYGFAFGLNWQGPINDWRTQRYGKSQVKE